MQRVTLENETKVGLLYALKDFTTETVKDLLKLVNGLKIMLSLFDHARGKNRTSGSRSAGRRRCFWRGCRT